jgi:hypothetical protein
VEIATAAQAAESLRQLPRVVSKQEFGNEAFLVSDRRFAAVAGQTLLLRLPPADLTAALRLPGARPFVSVGAMGRHGWVQIKLGSIGPATMTLLVEAAHAAALTGHRRSAIKKPSRARRVRSKKPS